MAGSDAAVVHAPVADQLLEQLHRLRGQGVVQPMTPGRRRASCAVQPPEAARAAIEKANAFLRKTVRRPGAFREGHGLDTHRATLGLGSATGSRRGGRNVNAMATAPRPMPKEPRNSQK